MIETIATPLPKSMEETPILAITRARSQPQAQDERPPPIEEEIEPQPKKYTPI